jgi:hypothetical protein
MIAFNRDYESAMTNADRQSRNALASGSWMLWIDSVGGFQLLEGDRFTLGGLGGQDPADIAVRSAWRRHVGTLQRIDDDFWMTAAGDSSQQRQHVSWDQPLPLPSREPALNSEPQLRLQKPSPLSRTAVLTLDPPHRFVTPVDAILLVDATVLIGQARNHHIRTPQYAGDTLVMSKRGDQWRITHAGGVPLPMIDGQTVEFDSLVMTLRREQRKPQLSDRLRGENG